MVALFDTFWEQRPFSDLGGMNALPVTCDSPPPETEVSLNPGSNTRGTLQYSSPSKVCHAIPHPRSLSLGVSPVITRRSGTSYKPSIGGGEPARGVPILINRDYLTSVVTG